MAPKKKMASRTKGTAKGVGETKPATRKRAKATPGPRRRAKATRSVAGRPDTGSVAVVDSIHALHVKTRQDLSGSGIDVAAVTTEQWFKTDSPFSEMNAYRAGRALNASWWLTASCAAFELQRRGGRRRTAESVQVERVRFLRTQEAAVRNLLRELALRIAREDAAGIVRAISSCDETAAAVRQDIEAWDRLVQGVHSSEGSTTIDYPMSPTRDAANLHGWFVGPLGSTEVRAVEFGILFDQLLRGPIDFANDAATALGHFASAFPSPDSRFVAELLGRCEADLGIDFDSISRLRTALGVELDQAGFGEIASLVEEAIARRAGCDADVTDSVATAADSGSTGGPPEGGGGKFPGLEVDRNGRTVRRGEHTIDFQAKDAQWRIFVNLYDAGGGELSREALSEGHEGQKTATAIRGIVGSLRRSLKDGGVELTVSKGERRRLEDLRPSAGHGQESEA